MKLNWLRNSVMLTPLVSLSLRITSADRPHDLSRWKKMCGQKTGRVKVEKIFFSERRNVNRRFLLTAIFSIALFGTGSLSSEAKAHTFFDERTVTNKCAGGEKMKSVKSKKFEQSKGKKMKSLPDKVDGFYQPFPFSREELIEKITKVLTTEDGLITKECVDTIFDVKLPVRVLGKDEIKDPHWTSYSLKPGVDWYFGIGLSRNQQWSMFHFYLNSTPCIGAEEFQTIANNAGWKRINAAQFSHNAPAMLREEYQRSNADAQLFIDLDPNSYCVKSIHVSNVPSHL